MRSLIVLETTHHNREWLLWTLFLSGLVVMGLAFYPAISGSIAEISVLFESPLMGTVLAAFGANADSLASLSGFYRTYASIYVTLLGCIYAALGGARRLSREEQRGTAEYLLTRPVSRHRVYWAKAAVLVAHLSLLNLVVLGVGFATLETFGRSAPREVFVPPRIVEAVAAALEEDPEAASRFVPRDRGLFDRVLVEAAVTQLSQVRESELAAAGIDRDALLPLMERLARRGPAALLDDVANNPGDYRAIFGGAGATEEEILAGVAERRAEIDATWRAFRDEPGRLGGLLRLAPKTLLGAAAETGTLSVSLSELGLPERWAAVIYAPYSRRAVAGAACFAFLAMVVFAAAGFFLSTLLRGPEAATGGAMAIVILAYFVDVITSAAGAGGVLRWISPIAMISMDSVGAGWRVLYFIACAGIASTAGAYAFSRRDIFVP